MSDEEDMDDVVFETENNVRNIPVANYCNTLTNESLCNTNNGLTNDPFMGVPNYVQNDKLVTCKNEYELFVRTLLEYNIEHNKFSFSNIQKILNDVVNIMKTKGSTIYIDEIRNNLKDHTSDHEVEPLVQPQVQVQPHVQAQEQVQVLPGTSAATDTSESKPAKRMKVVAKLQQKKSTKLHLQLNRRDTRENYPMKNFTKNLNKVIRIKKYLNLA